MIKAPLFIKGYSGEYAPAFSNKLHPCSVLKKGSNEEHGLIKRPHRAVLEQLYTTLLISTREQPFSSINALPKGFSNSS
ncbi:hypothetical protein CPS_3158 [Colwellia psychrerythraea 34H]|uniref:Uncharacterized protein n=1 Tax=Colwellia psychrerythraea (strain 34H / ATCC BAA-681) TaxID=167879 RepID=Q47ZB5_COLP3|nr:hypothetical protein CPS_3158 [Colwellia psychrerythraea 34H]